jgi:hypothetical protein
MVACNAFCAALVAATAAFTVAFTSGVELGNGSFAFFCGNEHPVTIEKRSKLTENVTKVRFIFPPRVFNIYTIIKIQM